MSASFDWNLENWKLWCRRKNWLPMGHVCQLAAMIRQAKQESQSATDSITPVYDGAAESFNDIVAMLPRRYLTVFLLNHLDKGIRGEMIVYSREPSVKYNLAGVGRTTFYERLKEAENLIKGWME